jgi:hypothetical protein
MLFLLGVLGLMSAGSSGQNYTTANKAPEPPQDELVEQIEGSEFFTPKSEEMVRKIETFVEEFRDKCKENNVKGCRENTHKVKFMVTGSLGSSELDSRSKMYRNGRTVIEIRNTGWESDEVLKQNVFGWLRRSLNVDERVFYPARAAAPSPQSRTLLEELESDSFLRYSCLVFFAAALLSLLLVVLAGIFKRC